MKECWLSNCYGFRKTRDENVFLHSADNKERVPLGLLLSKKQTTILIHLKYRVKLPNHDFPIGEKHKLTLPVYAETGRDT